MCVTGSGSGSRSIAKASPNSRASSPGSMTGTMRDGPLRLMRGKSVRSSPEAPEQEGRPGAGEVARRDAPSRAGRRIEVVERPEVEQQVVWPLDAWDRGCGEITLHEPDRAPRGFRDMARWRATRSATGE